MNEPERIAAPQKRVGDGIKPVVQCPHCLKMVKVVSSDGCGTVSGVAADYDALQAENVRLTKLVDAKDSLLVCYRVGKRPSEKLLDTLEKLKKKL